MTTLWWIIGSVIGMAVLIGACLTGRPIRTLCRSALEGFCALAAVNVLSMVSGVTLGVTAFSATVCALLGIPGTVTLLVLQTVFAMG